MMTKKVATGAAALAAAGAIVAGGAAISNASNETAGSGAGYDGYGQKAPEGAGGDRQGDRPQGQGRHEHTDVTGSEKTKVTDAVKAKDSAVTVQSVRKDPDGSYDVLGTKGGEQVMVEVSADLKTIEVRTGGPGGHGGPGGPGGHGGPGRGGQDGAGDSQSRQGSSEQGGQGRPGGNEQGGSKQGGSEQGGQGSTQAPSQGSGATSSSTA